MRLRAITLTAVIALNAWPGLARGVVVPIVNPGFEQPALSALCQFGPPITGWVGGNDYGVWRPGTAATCLHSFTGGPPEGQQIAYTNSDPLSQTLTTNLAANTLYTLTVKVGRRADCCQGNGYRVQLWAGTSMLSEDPGLLGVNAGTFRPVTLRFATGATHPMLGQALQIRLIRGAAGQGDFDDVHLEAVPADCNSNGIFDALDIAAGAPDVNLNGVPDSCEHICPADIAPYPAGDAAVNVSDLLAVINAWGSCPGACPPSCAADINHDCVVNVSDLLAIINGWGPCP